VEALVTGAPDAAPDEETTSAGAEMAASSGSGSVIDSSPACCVRVTAINKVDKGEIRKLTASSQSTAAAKRISWPTERTGHVLGCNSKNRQ
jgi:hypothetical protein